MEKESAIEEKSAIEEVLKGHRARLQQKLEKHIAKIEGIIEDLMAGVDVNTLNNRERILIAARYAQLYQKAITIDELIETRLAEEGESTAIGFLIRRFSGLEVKDKFRIIDTDGTSYVEDKGDGQ